jgi:hypothetical protein
MASRQLRQRPPFQSFSIRALLLDLGRAAALVAGTSVIAGIYQYRAQVTARPMRLGNGMF